MPIALKRHILTGIHSPDGGQGLTIPDWPPEFIGQSPKTQTHLGVIVAIEKKVAHTRLPSVTG